MTATGRKVLAAVALLTVGGFAPGCGDEETKGNHQIWFMGSIYNGATGQIVTGYEISLVSGKTTIRGTVDANGRYTLGPLQAWNDYAVTVSHQDYRGFVSYNAGIAPPTRPSAASSSGTSTQTTTITADDIYSANTTQTFNFDAYLFPAGLEAAGLTVNIVKPDATAPLPDGSIRLRPTSASSIQDQAAGVTGQVWANDQDMLAAVHSRDFTGGMVYFYPDELVYGVTYQVTVYDVDGFQPATTTVRGGLQDSLIVNITTAASPLLLISNTVMQQCRPAGQSTNVTMTAQATFTFNTSSLEDGTTSTGKGAELLDDGIQVVTQLGATLKADISSTASEHGTSFTITGNTLYLNWNPSAGLNTPTAGDVINSVTYYNLGSIYLQPSGHPEFRQSLQALYQNSSFIACSN